MSEDPLESLRASFLTESEELLDALRRDLEGLAATPGDAAAAGRVWRALHTLNGTSATFGYAQVSLLCEDAEAAWNSVRGGRSPVTRPLLEITRTAAAKIRTLLARPPADAGGVGHDPLGEALRGLVPPG